jgi:hypothetical protein
MAMPPRHQIDYLLIVIPALLTRAQFVVCPDNVNAVRLISQDRVQRLDPTPLSRPDRGRPTEIWLVGPCGSAI